MKNISVRACTLAVFFILSHHCVASVIDGTADAWREASVAVVGRVESIPAVQDRDNADVKRYVIEVEKAYKGTTSQCRIEFVDKQASYGYGETTPVRIQPGSRYLILLLTPQDRRGMSLGKQDYGDALSKCCAYRVDDSGFKEIETGLLTVITYDRLSRESRKEFLLKNLGNTNKYVQLFLEREILIAQLKETIPYYQQKLSQATTEREKLRLIAYLRCLDAPGIKETLRAWLADATFKDKKEVIEEMNKLGDKSLVPAIREHICATNELLAVAARSALFQLGDPQGMTLLLDMLKRSNDATVRYNAIFPLWHYSGNFSAEEKAAIAALVHDKDPAIARVAGFMVEKWQRKASKSAKAPQ